MDPGINFYCSNRKGYLPQPPREWSRVQNSCSVITPTDDTGLFQVPYSKKVIPYSELQSTLAMISKGNVLQYKKNSSNLTQWQKYSKIAKGQWVNRTKTWATQSDRGYTNPNNLNLIRVGGVNVTLNGTATTLPVTCPKPGTIVYPVLPANSGGGGGEPNPVLPPPPIAPVDGGNVIPITPVPVPEPVVIQDFGNLVCGTYENVCTGERTPIILLDNCHPTTDSDVPGTIEELCWNDGNPTWYPRQRYIMTNSDNKWPINAVLGCADKFTAPALSASVFCNVITLSWSFDPFYSIYNIFQDEYTLPIGVVSGTTNTFTVTINNPEPPGIHSFYIRGINGNVRSEASNIVLVTIDPPPAPVLSFSTFCNIATLTWTDTSPCNLSYQLYEDGVLIGTIPPDNYPFQVEIDPLGNSFYVIALIGSISSVPSNIVFVTIVPPPAPVLSVNTIVFDISNCNWIATLTWTDTSPCNLTYQIYEDNVLIGTVPPDNYPFQVAINAPGHSFSVIALLDSISSDPSIPIVINTLPPPPTPVLSVNTIVFDISNCNWIATLTWTNTTPCNLSYQVYEDGVLIGTVPPDNYPFQVAIDTLGHSFYVIALLNSISSDPSIPIVINTLPPPPAPTNLTYTLDCNTVTLMWDPPGTCNYTYEVYENTLGLIGTVPPDNYPFQYNLLTEGFQYYFYVIAVLSSISSLPSSTLGPIIFNEFQTNGLVTNYNPLSNGTSATGYTYILFNDSSISNYFFTYNCDNLNLYYMIVGPGGTGQSAATSTYFSIGGAGGGAGGIYNGLTNLSSDNYTITIPAVNNTSSTIIQNLSGFNITAETGGFISRGGVKVNGSYVSLPSTTGGQFGVGGTPSQVTQGAPGTSNPFVFYPGSAGGVVLQSPSLNNYITFMGDNLLSNTLFGGGGGGGGTGGNEILYPTTPYGPNHPATTGYNGGGGGGAGGYGISGGMAGGQGTNGLNGGTGVFNGANGGIAFTNLSPTPGYGGGGGGAGSVLAGDSVHSVGGKGGPAMLMIYFIKQY